jgi:hypothetical protein
MALRAVPQSVPTVIQQRVISGQLFNGALLVVDPVVDASNAMYKYAAPAGSVAGLFLWNTREALVIEQFLIDLGGSGNATVSVVNLDPATINDAAPSVLSGEALVIEAVTGVTRLVLNETNFRAQLLPFQALRLVTTNSSAAQIAQCLARLSRSRQY